MARCAVLPINCGTVALSWNPSKYVSAYLSSHCRHVEALVGDNAVGATITPSITTESERFAGTETSVDHPRSSAHKPAAFARPALVGPVSDIAGGYLVDF